MKIFETEDSYHGKVNFVDVNNIFVGYDISSHCCEHFGYFISENEEQNPREDEGIKEGLENYSFDKNYFSENEADEDNGGIVRFKLVAENKPDLFLHLYNFHNGYYAHGFTFLDNGKIIKESYI